MKSNNDLSKGFSLLEMVVAIAILAVSLSVLYQAVGGATRNVRADERYAYAVELARSLLAVNAQVPASGFSDEGETSGEFEWQVSTVPAPSLKGLPDGALQAIKVSVSWADGDKQRNVTLHSVVEGVRK
ncbi:MAG: prepilin-type N-terminal cleavage/methylation domain-containing protein [Halioglobus sp.]